MKNIKQIREHKVILAEREETEDRKLSSLVRAGLFDSKKLPALKKALDKSADKISGQEKRMLVSLLDSLMDQVLSNQSVYQKVKQNVMKEEYLDEGRLDPTTRDINDLPNIIMLRRRAIRSFPGGGKVVMYWADKINRYIPIPVDPVNTITRGPNIDGLNEAKAFSSMSDDEQDELVNSTRKMNPVLPAKKKKLMVRTKLGKQTQAQRLERIKKGRQYQAAIKFGGEHGYAAQAGEFLKGGNRAAALGTLAGGIVGSIARKMVKEGLETTRIRMKKMTVSPLTGVRKNTVVREDFRANLEAQRQLNENVILKALGAAGGAALKYGSKYADDALKYADDALKYGSKKVDDVGKYIGDKINKYKAGRKAAAEKAAKAARREQQLAKIEKFRKRNKNPFKGKKNKGLGFGAGAALASLTSGGGNSSGSTGDQYKTSYRKLPEIEGRTSSFTQRVGGPTTTIATRDTQLNRKALQQNYQQNENTIQMLKTISEGETKTINFNDGNDISVGYPLAKKIINIYESLNKNNKQAMANMLDESIDNFKKISKFAIDNRN
jgi:hypothetical protein